MSDFKWLSNLTKKNFVFQFNGDVFEVPAGKKRLFPRDVAEHGERRSYQLTDPVIDADGNVIEEGNNVIQNAISSEAEIESPTGTTGPILLQKNHDNSPISISSTVGNMLKKSSEQILKTKSRRKLVEDQLDADQPSAQE